MNEVEYESSRELPEAGRALIQELGEYFGCEPELEHIQRRIYKDTSCGAWLEVDAEGLHVGSIVEGVDWDTPTHTLTPGEYLAMEEGDLERWLDRNIEEVEVEAQEIWDETHGCDGCGPEDPETGYIPVRPDCPRCGGSGEVI